MIKVGLTGCRFSGKDTVAKAFGQIGIPVFDADTVLKFILNFDIGVNKDILEGYGEYVFTGRGGTLDSKHIHTDKDFDRLIDFAEFNLKKTYERFCTDNKNSLYTIFHSSILVERKWHEEMDFNISVFAPSSERAARSKMSIAKLESMGEMNPLSKNNACDFVIHCYQSVLGDSIDQVSKIDRKIVDSVLCQKEFIGEEY